MRYRVPAMVAIALLIVLSLAGCVSPTLTPAPEPTPPAITPAPEPPETPDPTPPKVVTPAPVEDAGRVDIVYFHRTARCHSCVYAEEQTVATLDEYFADELRDGVITFKSVDLEDKGSAELVEKYNAGWSQLFLTITRGETETTAEIIELWGYIDDDNGFSMLIRSEVNKALESIG